MAVTYTERVDAQSATSFGAGAYSPAAFTPTAGAYLVAVAQAMSDAGAVDMGAAMTISDTQGMTWSKIGDVGDAASWGIGIAAWISSAVPAAVSTTVSIDAGANFAYNYYVWCAEIAGGDGTAVGYVEDTTAVLDGAETLTLAATPTADDLCIGASFVDQDGAMTPSAGSGASMALSRSAAGGGDAAVVTHDALASTSFALFTDRNTTGTGTYKAVSMAFIVKAAGGPPTDPVVVANGGAAFTTNDPAVTFSGYTPVLNDLVVLYISSTTVLDLVVDASLPTGWFGVLGSGVDVNSDSHGMCAVYHFVTAGEVSGGTTTYTCTDALAAAETGYVQGVVIRNVDTTTPIDSAASTFNSGNTITPHVLAALTGSDLSNSSLVVSSVAADSTGGYAGSATGYTTIRADNTNNARWIGYGTALTTAGVNWSAQNITPSAGDEYCSITAAFTKRTGTTVNLTQATESDSALTMAAAVKAVTLGIVTETDTAPALVPTKTVTLGLVVETDTTAALTAAETVTLGMASETDSGQTITVTRDAITLGLATETDTSFGMSFGFGVEMGLATETDTSAAVTLAKTITLGLATETDTSHALSFGFGVEMGLATETDTSAAVSLAKTVTLGLATESDTGAAVTSTKAVALGLATESDSALAATTSEPVTVNLGVAEEVDSHGLVDENDEPILDENGKQVDGFGDATLTKVVTFGQASETDSTFAASTSADSGVVNLGLASETDTSADVTRTKTVTFGLAAESDTTAALSAVEAHTFGQASETDSAFALVLAETVTAGQPSETDTTAAITRTKVVSLGLATESDAAFPATTDGSITVALGLATETDAGAALAAVKTVTLGLALEADTAATAALERVFTLTAAGETDSALAVTRTKVLTLGQAVETSQAQSLAILKGAFTFGTATEVDSVLEFAFTGAGFPLIVDATGSFTPTADATGSYIPAGVLVGSYSSTVEA